MLRVMFSKDNTNSNFQFMRDVVDSFPSLWKVSIDYPILGTVRT